MPKLEVLDDGTVQFPIKGGKVLTLDEPNLSELAWMHDETERIDQSMTDLPTLPPQIDVQKATAEEVQEFRDALEAYNEASKARTMEVFGAEGHQPYGALALQVLQKLALTEDGAPVGADEITVDSLYGWAASPRVMRTLLEHFRSPLPGKASLPNL